MSILLLEFCEIIDKTPIFSGDILEFGTGTGNSTKSISEMLPNRRIVTFDGFVGLPETQKGIPTNTEWYVGNYCYDYETIKKELSNHKNVDVFKRMSWEIIDPTEFNIINIGGVNIDFDLYEGTIDALRFVTKCKWSDLLIRFDDWGCHPHQNAMEVDKHEKAAFYDWIEETNYSFIENRYLFELSEGMQSIFRVSRA